MRTSLRRLLVIVTTAIVAGIVFEQIGRHQDRLQYSQVGRSINVGGHSLNIYCAGKGVPTVVFDTFSHMAGIAWSGVQPEVSRFTRACWYDRAGYGWSEPAQSPPTFLSDAAALHTLLSASGETPPYVFIGPGDAVLRLRIYHAAYPREVSGIVMIDPIGIDDFHFDVADEAKGPWARYFGDKAQKVMGAACRIAPVFSRIGIFRLVSLFGHPRPTPSLDISPADQKELDFLSDNPTASGTNLAVCSRSKYRASPPSWRFRRFAPPCARLWSTPNIAYLPMGEESESGHSTNSSSVFARANCCHSRQRFGRGHSGCCPLGH